MEERFAALERRVADLDKPVEGFKAVLSDDSPEAKARRRVASTRK